MIYLEVDGNVINDLLDLVCTDDSEELEELEVFNDSSFHNRAAFFEALDSLPLCEETINFIKRSYNNFVDVPD